MAEDAITLTAVSVDPNDCPLGAPLTIKMKFTATRAINKAVWDLKYMVDMASKRKLIALGTTEETSYAAGTESSMEVSSAGIDTTHFKPHHLANAGLVVATLLEDGKEAVTVNLVTQVTTKDGELIRTVYSPLEE
eukprot:CAMPEP_0181323666 /NCGR_PEP_ID=MMETSP1101-20121128/19918_1 /TAXON_ID=46948 /ORGANISM="Rhodomonas abbreviata, Strain Caron Lab Isolate" /LENGTH=134 /DNA_ID=CAMNT_0023431731 /DNA_START=10 /DNA_END=414 /DNA_ORIENTATION=+